MSPPVYRDRRGAVVELGEELGAGGEGSVRAVRGRPRLCAKIYRPDRAAARAAKIAAMVERRPSFRLRGALAWPVELLHEGDAFAGFLMPAVPGAWELHRLLVPGERLQVAGFLTQRDLHAIAAGLAHLVAAVHRMGHCVGDLKPQNVLVSPLRGRVALVDTDSFQIRARRPGEVHRCRVVTPEYAAPELQGADLDRVERTPASDAFALAVLIHQLLLGGSHPFEGVLAPGLAGSVERIPGRIRRGMSPLGPGAAVIRPPAQALPMATLHPALREAFARCFGAGHASPAERPGAEAWREILLRARDALARCPRSEAHAYERGLPRCPWCERRERGGLDLFPEGQRWQRGSLARTRDLAAAPEAQRIRWFLQHVRGRVAGGALPAAERAFLDSAGAALGFQRVRVARMIEEARAAAMQGSLPARWLRGVSAVLRRPRPASPGPLLARLAGALPRRRRLLISALSLASAGACATGVLAAARPSAGGSDGVPRAAPECAVLELRAVIGNTQGRGAFLRAAPSLAGDKVPLADGAVVRVTGRIHAADQLQWSEVEVVLLGRTGWVATKYLVASR